MIIALPRNIGKQCIGRKWSVIVILFSSCKKGRLMYMQSNTSPKLVQLSNLLNKIQLKSLNKKPIDKKSLQKAMNNLENTLLAFNKIAKNKGAGTAGVDEKTIDGLTIERIQKLHDDYRLNLYEPKPVKQVKIPKKNSTKERHLGVPTINDRIMQQALLQILEPYYEQQFSQWSFGFRKGKSCHDAVQRVKERFKGVDWLIKIDIKGYFDSINHEILNKLLTKNIKKHKSLITINNWLRVGLIEMNQLTQTLSGTPQGGIISPLLSNIYLHEIDIKMEKLIQRGVPKRKANSEYGRLRHKNYKTDYIPRYINTNANPRIEYIRYADDFIIGVSGTLSQAEDIMKTVNRWLIKDLNLEISKQKSKIIKANKGTKFLSYMIKVNPTANKIVKKTTKKSLNGAVRFLIPKKEIDNRTEDYGWIRKENVQKGKKRRIIHDDGMANREELEIVKAYKSILLGIARYFAKGENLAQLSKLSYVAEYSCLMTLARKRKCSIAKIRKKLNVGKTWSIKYKHKDKIKHETWPKLDWNGFKRMRFNKQENLDEKPNKFAFTGRTRLTDRLSSKICERCKQSNQVLEIHHTKTVRNSNWQSTMNKQTMALCKECHRKITNQQLKSFKHSRKTQLKVN